MKQKMAENIRYIKSNYLLYLLVAPAVILTIIFKYVPIYGLLIAFKDYNPLNGIMGSEWVGLEHFTRFISSPNFSILLVNTLKLSVYGLLLGFFPPIILALSFNLLASDKFISVVVIAGMLFLFFANKGPINNIFESLTGKTLPFLTGPKYFRPLYIFSGIWQGIGWSSILYTATLANVPPELIEASEIDGANILQRIWYIDLPALKPVMTISFILAAGGIMSIGYEKAYLLQTTMNLPSSEIIATYVYKVGLQSGDYSYSTAVGLFNSVINLILLVSVNQIIKKMNDGEGL